jgi:hypothetical protein
VKQRVSREMRERRAKNIVPRFTFDVGADDLLPQFWQKRFYDFNVWSRKKQMEKLEYMHLNPLKRGLVMSPGDWIWSSYSWYGGGTMDW